MTDTIIIWEIMSEIVKDDHPSIYQYVKGRKQSKETAVMRITGILAPIFYGAYDISKVRSVVRSYLKQKELDWKNGKIKIKSIY